MSGRIKKTFTAKIAVGFREGYTDKVHTLEEAYAITQTYCNKMGLCVSVTPTRFIYTQSIATPHGFDDGCFIELIAYPRFPFSKYDIIKDAIELAKIFVKEFNQMTISVIASDQTYLIEKKDLKSGYWDSQLYVSK